MSYIPSSMDALTGSGHLSDARREVFRAISDILIPATETMPSASGADVHGPVIDRLLDLRPDLKDRFLRGLDAAMERDPELAARELNQSDPTALAAIGLLASAAYYMNPEVRQRIGYPGQTARRFDASEASEYMTNGQLQRVIDRGPIFRPTPSH